MSRALGAEKLGVYSATLAFVQYFMLAAMLGVENYGNRTIAAAQDDQKKRQSLFWNVYAVQFFMSMIAIIAYGVSFHFISPDRYAISIVQGLWLVSCLLNINWFFFGIEQFRLTVIRSIIIKLVTVILIVLFIRTPDDLVLYAIIMSGDMVLSNILVWPFLRKWIKFEKPSLSQMKDHIRPILILFVPILAMSVFHVMDKSMLDWLSTERDVGYYYSADKIINIPLAVITALSTVMLPRISNEYSRGELAHVGQLLKKSTELTVFLSCAIGVGVASIAKEFIPFFFGAGYDACIELVYWFTPVLFVKAIGDLIRSQYMIPSHMDKQYTVSVVIGAIVNLVANYIFIQKLGALGAVLGTLAAEASVTIIQIVFTSGQIPFLKYVFRNLAYVLIAGIMLLAVRMAATYIHFPVAARLVVMIVIGAVVYMIGCLLWWSIDRSSIFHAISLDKLLRNAAKRPQI